MTTGRIKQAHRWNETTEQRKAREKAIANARRAAAKPAKKARDEETKP